MISLYIRKLSERNRLYVRHDFDEGRPRIFEIGGLCFSYSHFISILKPPRHLSSVVIILIKCSENRVCTMAIDPSGNLPEPIQLSPSSVELKNANRLKNGNELL